MKYQHKGLAGGRWNELTLAQQLANVGSEVGRAISWKERDAQIAKRAIFRALELMGLTIVDPKNRTRLKELCRTRELLIDYFAGGNVYGSDKRQWEKYFFAFNYLARRVNAGTSRG